MNSEKKHIMSALLQSKIFFFVLLLLTVISLFRLGNEITRRVKINREISNLKNQIHDLQEKQQQLSALTTYLGTDTYIDEEARTKLNLKKPGEKVYVVEDQQQGSSKLTAKAANPELWLHYFTD